MASIISLPPEILHRIYRFLGRTDVYSARLTCGTLASASYDQFAKQEVSEVYLALTSNGLTSLEELTSFETLRTYVKELWILPTLFGNHYDWTLNDITRLDKRAYRLPGPYFAPGANPRERFPPGALPLCEGRPVRNGRLIREDPRFEPDQRNLKQHRVYQDAIADHFKVLLGSVDDTSRSSDMTQLQRTLTHCLPFFPNLCAIGLRDTYYGNRVSDTVRENAKRKVRGVQKLEKILGFDIINPPTGAMFDEPDPDFTRHFYTTLLQSRLFRSLMVAIGATNTRVETLQAYGLMADDGLSVTQDEENSLRPIMYDIRHLSLNICSVHGQENERNKLQRAMLKGKLAPYFQPSAAQHPRPGTNPDRLLPILSQAGPNLESLHLACPGGQYAEVCKSKTALGLVDTHFVSLANKFQFTRLSALSLRQIMTSLPTFMRVLSTALPTLRELNLDDIVWTSDRHFELHEKRVKAEEAVHLMREIVTHFRDPCALRLLVIGTWTYQDLKIVFRNPLRGDRESLLTLYDAKYDTVSFTEWVDHLRFKVTVSLGEIRRRQAPEDLFTVEG
ncbi:hypothetical protein BDW74DRAFT_175980 [Aspergillus multicolor]|uniref:F-box protein n=1 Tax=Aspergillus multicolor TaxID=41759 RepID=UPI003CCE19D7